MWVGAPPTSGRCCPPSPPPQVGLVRALDLPVIYEVSVNSPPKNETRHFWVDSLDALATRLRSKLFYCCNTCDGFAVEPSSDLASVNVLVVVHDEQLGKNQHREETTPVQKPVHSTPE